MILNKSQQIIQLPRSIGGETILIRPIQLSDQTQIRAFLRRLSSETLYERFFTPGIDLGLAEKVLLAPLEQDDQVAFVAATSWGRIIGYAQYVPTDPGEAEIALIVEDGYQGYGIGGQFMRTLISTAQANNFHTLIADVLGTNWRMMALLKKSGLVLTTQYDRGVNHVTIALAPIAAPV